jgi:hypothetical protein
MRTPRLAAKELRRSQQQVREFQAEMERGGDRQATIAGWDPKILPRPPGVDPNRAYAGTYIEANTNKMPPITQTVAPVTFAPQAQY